jgi:hypothetical protein
MTPWLGRIENTRKLTRFQDIPQMTQAGSWECDFDLEGAWHQIKKWVAAEDGTSPLDLNPDFQRAHVWTEAQQIAWLEFWLRGGKTGRVLYFNHSGWFRKWDGDFVVVDGKQRIEAIRRFLDNEIPTYGSLCREFTDMPRAFVQTIKINVNDLQSRAAVLQWYIEFNAGGTPHTDADIQRVRELLEAERK